MTDDFERELHERLTARADSLPVRDDYEDLLERSARRSRRTVRALSFAMVLVVCGAGVAVVIAARRDSSASAKKPVAVAAAHVVATGATVPTVLSAPSGPTFATANNPDMSSSALKVAGPIASPSVGVLLIGGSQQPMAKVFTRTTGSGATVRTYRVNASPSAISGGPPWWTPPGWCYPNAYVQADVSDSAIAAATSGALFAEQENGSKVGGTLSIIGQAEQAVRWVVIAQGPSTAARIRATFPNGSSDEMAPVGGVAVLIGTGAATAANASVNIEAFDAAGRSLGTNKVANPADPYIGAPGSLKDRNACVAPQTLPRAGVHQPADAAAARQDVIDLFDATYKHGISDSSFVASFDDAHGFTDVAKQLRTGPYKQQANTAQMKLNDLVFLDPTTAAIQYEIDIPNYAIPSFSPAFHGSAPHRRAMEARVPRVVQRRVARRGAMPGVIGSER